ncbi:M23 family metallopeptidase [Saccharopolyspora phatthalungensis]|uniref:Murein DD-endopeptidase MepM/ murein hydrolase activator NlpD n=1 Tax=Saccharopolyspora phatthalungensis TaxID=664693 RepID=A0A840PUK3_9PSEU|nr:M23 family metallopeptidase [Saccharopolyspora phatthalungensis]MBB5153972.1 murein DD-endopeptidase MepM/ murein hydrolase activator NlpD [Saccharopolyspora phatthalungensis]
MAMRQKTVIGGLVVLLVISALGPIGAVTAALAVQDAHPKLPAVGRDRAVNFAARAPRRSERAVEPPPAWVTPTEGEISSGFGERGGTVHKGIDIANEIGTPIRAVSPGTVIDCGPASGFGLWIRIVHQGDVVSIYGHIDETFVAVGQPVRPGQLIATMGDRGQSTGPHLHFQLEVAGRPVDPELFYRDVSAWLTH